MLKLLYRFIPSLASPSLRFLGFFPNSRYRLLIFFHWEELAGWRSILLQSLSSACHVRFFTSSALVNRRLNLAMIGRYHNTFVGGPFLVLSSLLHLTSSFTLYCGTPHLGQLCIFSNSFLQYAIIRACMNLLVLHTHRTLFSSLDSNFLTTCFPLKAYPAPPEEVQWSFCHFTHIWPWH